MKVLTVKIIIKDEDKFVRKEFDSYAMCFKEQDVDKAYELFNIIKRGMQKKQYERDIKEGIK